MASDDGSVSSQISLHYLIQDGKEDSNSPLLTSFFEESVDRLTTIESSPSSEELEFSSVLDDYRREVTDDDCYMDFIDSPPLESVLEVMMDSSFKTSSSDLQLYSDTNDKPSTTDCSLTVYATEYLEGFAKKYHLSTENTRRLRADFTGVELQSLSNFQSDELWILNCEFGYEFQVYIQSVFSPLCPRNKEAKSVNRRRICIHTFCLDLLYHDKFKDVVEWIDKKQLIFRVVNPSEIAKLWKRVKGNSKVDYETFGRGIRFSMDRGFFTKLRPQKKKVYRLTEKALRSYREFRPTSKLRRT